MCVFKLLQALVYLCLLQELQIVAKLHLNEKSLKITLPSCGKNLHMSRRKSYKNLAVFVSNTVNMKTKVSELCY